LADGVSKIILIILGGYRDFLVPLQLESSGSACRWCPTTFEIRREGMREESPGSTGRPTSENGSSWRQLVSEEENNRPSKGKGEKVV